MQNERGKFVWSDLLKFAFWQTKQTKPDLSTKFLRETIELRIFRDFTCSQRNCFAGQSEPDPKKLGKFSD